VSAPPQPRTGLLVPDPRKKEIDQNQLLLNAVLKRKEGEALTSQTRKQIFLKTIFDKRKEERATCKRRSSGQRQPEGLLPVHAARESEYPHLASTESGPGTELIRKRSQHVVSLQARRGRKANERKVSLRGWRSKQYHGGVLRPSSVLPKSARPWSKRTTKREEEY